MLAIRNQPIINGCMTLKPIIIIPARMASTRLPGKPLADIGGLPMIVQVMKRAQAASLGPVAVACDGEEIAAAVRAHGGEAVLTDPGLPSGSDRIFAALQKMDPKGEHDVVINVQGDMPLLDPAIIVSAAELLQNALVDIGTLAAPLREEEITDPNVVKVWMSPQSSGSNLQQGPVRGKAKGFSRHMPATGEGRPATYHHIGIYAYRREALEKFVAMPPSANERREKLEQLRALDAGMRIDVAVVDTVPLGVDTPEGLEKARGLIPALAAGSGSE